MLKDGTHTFQFWRSSADDTLAPLPGQWHIVYIYLTIDNNVFPFLSIYSIPIPPVSLYTRVLNSPVAVYPDTWTTVCNNMQWNAGTYEINNVAQTAYDMFSEVLSNEALKFETQKRWIALPYSESGGSIYTASCVVLPIQDLIRFAGSLIHQPSFLQDYIDASEQASQNESDLYAKTTDYRNIQGWKMMFAFEWGVIVPEAATVSKFTSNFPITRGWLIYDYNGQASIIESIPVLGRAAKIVHFLTVVDLEFMIHSFEGPEDRRFQQLPFRADFRIIRNTSNIKTVSSELKKQTPNLVWLSQDMFMQGLELYKILTWDQWKTQYTRNTNLQLPDPPAKKNRPGANT